jgi:hypothetical protein
MDQATRTRIAAEESKRFLDDNFGSLDLSGSPDLLHPVSEQFQAEDEHGFNRIDTSGLPTQNQLRTFVQNPTIDVLNDIAAETKNPTLVEEVIDRREEAEALAFIRANPDYDAEDGNYELIRDYISKHDLEWSAPNLTRAYKSLVRAGEITPIGGRHNLRESEKLTVISMAKSGQIDDAVAQYLDFVFPAADERWIDGREFLSDPTTLDARNQAVRFVWFHSRPVETSEAWEQFQRKWFKLRPMITLNDLDAAWAAFEKQGAVIERDRMLYGQPDTAPTPSEIDQLDDGAVDRLYHSTLRHYAKTAKASGILV